MGALLTSAIYVATGRYRMRKMHNLFKAAGDLVNKPAKQLLTVINNVK